MADDRISLAMRSTWEKALEGIPHVFGHTWGACHALSLNDNHPTFLYVASDDGRRVACPLIERPIDDRIDVATPYGFSGFTGTGPWSEFPSHWQRFAGERGYVCGYLAVNALYGDTSYADPASSTVVNETYVIDLRDGIEPARAALSTNRKRQLRAWHRDLHESDTERLATFFVDEYPRAMERKDAVARHRFARETLTALCESPGTFLLGAVEAEQIQSVSLFGHTPYGGDFLFNAALPGAEHHSVALIWSATHRLVDLGVPWLNLGGGMRPGDALADFKARFGAKRLPMRAVKAIYDQSAYAELCRQRAVDPHANHGYFPAYRDD